MDSLGARERVEIVGESPLVEVDAAQIQRVLANLIENAIAFSPPVRAVLVRITATRKEAIVRVVDQGPGSPEAELERVFEPFYRRAVRARAAEPVSVSPSRAASPRRTADGCGRSRARIRERRSRSRFPSSMSRWS